MQFVRVRLFTQNRCPIIISKRILDRIHIVCEVENECIVLERMRAVQPGQRLHRLDPRQQLVYVHRVQQRLVISSLELLRHDQEPVRVGLDIIFDLAARKAIQTGFRHLSSAVLMLAGESHNRLPRAPDLFQVVLKGMKILDRPANAARDDHRPRLPADLSFGNHLGVEVVHHNFGLFPDCVLMALHVSAQFPLRLLRVELRVFLDGFHQPVVAADWRVIL